MNKITENLTACVKPELAVIVYRYKPIEDESSYYIERRDIDDSGKMGAGVPLTEDCISGIAKSFSSTDRLIVHGEIPANMLYADCRHGREKYVWYRKPEKRAIFFTDSLGIPSGQVFVPGLVYKVEKGELYVFSYVAKRLTSKTQLYRAPFLNVYTDGKICLGNAKVKRSQECTYSGIMEYWEDMFWKSEFSHLLGMNPVRSNISLLYKKLVNTGEAFPVEELVKEKMKVGGLLK